MRCTWLQRHSAAGGETCNAEFLRWFRPTAEINPLLRLFRERELPHPTLYLMGEEDHLFLPAVRATVARHGRSVLEVIRGSGHVCNVEQPDVFNRLAMAFMRQPDLALRSEAHTSELP